MLSILPPEAAMKLCDKTVQRDGRAAWAWLHKGMTYARTHDPSAAVLALQSAVRLQGENAGAWEALAESYRALGRYTGSLKVCHCSPLKRCRADAETDRLLSMGSAAYLVRVTLQICQVC